jgi:hypothetical protein
MKRPTRKSAPEANPTHTIAISRATDNSGHEIAQAEGKRPWPELAWAHQPEPPIRRVFGNDAAMIIQAFIGGLWLTRAILYGGQRWLPQTYSQWQESTQLPLPRLKRAIARLEACGVLATCQPPILQPRCKFYRVSFSDLGNILDRCLTELDYRSPDGWGSYYKDQWWANYMGDRNGGQP